MFSILYFMSRVIIDVRSPAEYSGGHVEGAFNVPLNVLPSVVGQLDKRANIVVYCASGSRSAMAEKILKGYGFSNVVNGKTRKDTEKLIKNGR